MPSPRTERALARLADLTPTRIVADLDRYIIGQASAKKAVAIALRNRWRRQHTPDSIRPEISPNNIILIGPTGCGKTEIARRVSRLAAAPFIKVEASKFTEVGYVGRDVESMVRDLIENAMDLVRGEREVEITSEASERVEERLLDALLPAPIATPAGAASPSPTHGDANEAPGIFLVGSAGSATTAPVSDGEKDRHMRTREKLRTLLREGQLELRTIDLEVPASSSPMFGMVNQPGAQEGMEQFTQMMQDLMPRKTKRRSLTVAEARRVLLQQEFDRMLDRDEVIAEAIERTGFEKGLFAEWRDESADPWIEARDAAMVELLANPARAEAMGAAGLERVRERLDAAFEAPPGCDVRRLDHDGVRAAGTDVKATDTGYTQIELMRDFGLSAREVQGYLDGTPEALDRVREGMAVKPAGGSVASPPRKLWHSSPGSSGR